MQFIVISLKTGFFQGSEALVGVYRDQGANSSKTLTLDVCFSFWIDMNILLTFVIVAEIQLIVIGECVRTRCLWFLPTNCDKR